MEIQRVIQRQQAVAVDEKNGLSRGDRGCKCEFGAITNVERAGSCNGAPDIGSADGSHIDRSGIRNRKGSRCIQTAYAGDVDGAKIADRTHAVEEILPADIPDTAQLVLEC